MQISRKYDKVFSSSATTSDIPSKRYVADVKVYEESFQKGFALFYGDIKEYALLALLPSYLEREGSSLVYMAEDLVKNTNNPHSGFYLNDYDKLVETLTLLESRGQRTLLLGVTYALLKLVKNSRCL